MDNGMNVLSAPPGDGISSMVFSPCDENLLLLSSWDSTTRVYDVQRNQPKNTFNFDSPCLACCFDSSGSHAYAGGINCSVHSLDLTRGASSVVGSHSKAVSCLQYSAQSNSILSGSWDGTVQSIDPRCSPASQAVLELGSKVFTLSTINHRVVIGSANRLISIYDLRNLSAPEEVRESPLRHQTRRIACDPHGLGFAIGSTEGRVAVEYFGSEDSVQSKKYAFKCHRIGDSAFPVNAICFNPYYGTFATGGCDGTVSFWDGTNRRKLNQLPPFPTSIAALAFSASGSNLAIASSYTFEQGPKPNTPQDYVFLRRIDESDMKVRPRV